MLEVNDSSTCRRRQLTEHVGSSGFVHCPDPTYYADTQNYGAVIGLGLRLRRIFPMMGASPSLCDTRVDPPDFH